MKFFKHIYFICSIYSIILQISHFARTGGVDFLIDIG